MSKFQVGDYVQHRRVEDVRGEVITVDLDVVVQVAGRNYAAGANNFDLVAAAGEWVPDVDGNPIRVGTLVEHDDGRICRVKKVADPPAPRLVDSDSPGTLVATPWGSPDKWEYADHWRVLTADDLHRPPEPPTRDVALRVVVKGVQSAEPNDEVEGWLRKDVFEGGGGLPYQYGDDNVTVEVIEDGDSHA